MIAHLWHVNAFLCNREFPGISCYIKRLLIYISTDMDPQSFSYIFICFFFP